MDAGKLFAQLMNRGESASGGILTGTAVSDSVDGSVMVQMDGSVVAQPSEDETELVVSAEEFADGSYVLPSVPYAGTLTVADSNGNELEEEDYTLDGSTLTIHALSSAPVDVSYETNVQQVLTNSDFDGDTYSLPSTTNLTVREDGAAVPYTLDGNLLTIEGIEHVTGVVEFAYTYDVSQVCSAGVNVLPNAPDEVAVFGRNSSGVDVVVTDYVLSGSTITLPETYDAYTVDYPVSMVERWNVSDQYEEIPLEDSDDAADPETVTIGHNLQWEPSSVTSCTVDGVSTTYTLDVANVVVDAPTITERYITLTYDLPVRMQVPASSFAVGPFTLPSVPVGSVITTMGGSVLANTVDDTQLTIDSLLTDSPTYTLTYTEQVEQDVVELPCTPYVAEGQFVEVAVVNGMPTVIGASGSGDVTMTLAGDAADAAAAAEEAAGAAEEVANRTAEHFWADAQGVHVTELSREDWETSQTGANQLSNSAGILLRDGLTNFAQLTPGETAFYDGTGNNASNVVATFGTSGSVIGKAAESHAFIDYRSLQLVDKEGSTFFKAADLRDSSGHATITETLVGHQSTLEYRVTLPVTTAADCSVTVNGVPVTFSVSDGDRTFTLDNAPADFSTVEITYITTDQKAKLYSLGFRTGAEGPMSLAVGDASNAAGGYSYAGGRGATAWGRTAYAMGDHPTAWGYASVAEGNYTKAFGDSCRAQNQGTIANGNAQTALGRYNVADTTSAVIIGNGTGITARSNALTVDWSGNVTTAGSVSAVDVTASGDVSADTITTTGNATIGGSVSANSATLTTPLALGYGGTGATTSIDAAANLQAVRYRSGMNVTVQNQGGAEQLWGLRVTIVNANNTNYAGHELVLMAQNNGLRIYDESSDNDAVVWNMNAEWVSLGSFTGTNSRTISLTNYNEVMVAAKANGKLVTATVAKQLLTSSAQELWLGGGKSSGGTANSGNLRAVVNISLTTVKGVDFSEGSTNRTSSTTWNVYAR